MSRPPIVDVLETLGLPTPGRDYGGWQPVQCGFHDDRTASASVSPDAGKFHCFACDFSGDVYDILQKAEGMTYREALAWGEGKGYRDENPMPGHRRQKVKYTPPGRRGRR